MTGTDNPTVEALPPGIRILENRALGEPSPKVDHVRSLLDGIEDLDAAQLVDRLRSILADHEVPEGAMPTPRDDGGEPIPAEVKAACVHTERYGTRWSGIVTVPASASEPPSVRYAEGPPCCSPFRMARLWP